MKIVINKCYGGFSLSPKAVKRIAELQGKECHFFTRALFGEDFYPISFEESLKDSFSWTAFSVPNPESFYSEKGWMEKSTEERIEMDRQFGLINLPERPEDRTCPALVQAVEELGKEANGSCADLRVIEIPDGIQWELSEYDGIERVEEIHRSWS